MASQVRACRLRDLAALRQTSGVYAAHSPESVRPGRRRRAHRVTVITQHQYVACSTRSTVGSLKQNGADMVERAHNA
jgi:hypothetical protein